MNSKPLIGDDYHITLEVKIERVLSLKGLIRFLILILD